MLIQPQGRLNLEVRECPLVYTYFNKMFDNNIVLNYHFQYWIRQSVETNPYIINNRNFVPILCVTTSIDLFLKYILKYISFCILKGMISGAC